MCSEKNTNGLFEVHIAGPKTDAEVARRIFEDLREAGLPKSKFFLNVYNILGDEMYEHVMCTPPTGHDLDEPGWMTTVKTPDFEEAKKKVLAGMDLLKQHGLRGNFEVERVITEGVPDFPIDIEKEFPGYRRVQDSPLYENHIIWKDLETKLPSNNEIVEEFQRSFGITPHQIVDFSRALSGQSLVSRVATIYQPSRETALEWGLRLTSDKQLTGHRYIVTEQVCLVGELKTD
ncbi:MAG: hypothetical protein Q7R76_05065 [Candidatus Woesearchaeota archaeon]|nr:hypothetical protein [Candidatus Woesearchaeota archaeon]